MLSSFGVNIVMRTDQQEPCQPGNRLRGRRLAALACFLIARKRTTDVRKRTDEGRIRRLLGG
ncbi:hypothetical protein C725_1355 [Pacificimonas flava]|uniref:Uncharacterized protein n=1 Tax=Pacificimonas flava TaxID=1234595 RepID=M2TA44_9SPHN|nr:hypothetical protein C725_1355 [Pacificimonas flava]